MPAPQTSRSYRGPSRGLSASLPERSTQTTPLRLSHLPCDCIVTSAFPCRCQSAAAGLLHRQARSFPTHEHTPHHSFHQEPDASTSSSRSVTSLCTRRHCPTADLHHGHLTVKHVAFLMTTSKFSAGFVVANLLHVFPIQDDAVAIGAESPELTDCGWTIHCCAPSEQSTNCHLSADTTGSQRLDRG